MEHLPLRNTLFHVQLRDKHCQQKNGCHCSYQWFYHINETILWISLALKRTKKEDSCHCKKRKLKHIIMQMEKIIVCETHPLEICRYFNFISHSMFFFSSKILLILITLFYEFNSVRLTVGLGDEATAFQS